MPTLPVSPALREAAPEGVNDLYNRAVEGLEDREIDLIIADQRAARVRYAQAEAAGTKKTRAPKTEISTDFRRSVGDEMPEL